MSSSKTHHKEMVLVVHLIYTVITPKVGGAYEEIAAMETADQVEQWLHRRGLSVSGRVPPTGGQSRRMRVLGAFNSISYAKAADLPMSGSAFPKMDAGEYTLAIYTAEDAEVTEHYANSDDPSRMVFDKAIGEKLTLDPFGKEWDGVWKP